MKKKAINISLAVVAALILGLWSMTSFAGPWGGGYGYGGGYGQGGCWNTDNLSPEIMKKLQDERRAFFNETKDLRQQLNEKKAELNLELSRKEINIDKASAIQKDISDIQAKIARKRLLHIVKMKKIDPDFRCYMRKGMGKKGRWHHGNKMKNMPY